MKGWKEKDESKLRAVEFGVAGVAKMLGIQAADLDDIRQRRQGVTEVKGDERGRQERQGCWEPWRTVPASYRGGYR